MTQKAYVKNVCFSITQEQLDFFNRYPRLVMAEFLRDALDRAIGGFEADPERSMAEYIAKARKETVR